MLEEVLERPLADLPQPFRSELEPTLPLLDETGLLESPRQSLQLSQRRGSLLAQEVPDAIEIDVRERARLRRSRQHGLEPVELAQALEHVRGLGQPHALATAEGGPPTPLLAGKGRPQVSR